MKRTSLLLEEKNSTILFLWLFYIVFFVYEIFYHNLFPITPWSVINPEGTVWYNFMIVKYGIMILLIPFSIYLIRNKKAEKQHHPLYSR